MRHYKILNYSTYKLIIFLDTVHRISRKYISRGCRKEYVPGLSQETKSKYEVYTELFTDDPFSEETI